MVYLINELQGIIHLVKGYISLLDALNEVETATNVVGAFSVKNLPILVVLLFRFWTDPLGWSSWDETNWFGMFLLICLAILWLLVDLYRILRVRRMLRTIEKQNIAIASRKLQIQDSNSEGYMVFQTN